MTSTQEKLREQVAAARERLGGTVDELASRTDVKHRAQAKAADVRHAVADHTPGQVRKAATQAARTGRDNPLPAATAATALVIVLAYLSLRRRSAG